MATWLSVVARRVVETNIEAHEDFGEVYADRFDLVVVVVVHIALLVQRAGARVARRPAPLLIGIARTASISTTHHQPGRCVRGSRGMPHRSVSALRQRDTW
jgi:hypothetical protein